MTFKPVAAAPVRAVSEHVAPRVVSVSQARLTEDRWVETLARRAAVEYKVDLTPGALETVASGKNMQWEVGMDSQWTGGAACQFAEFLFLSDQHPSPSMSAVRIRFEPTNDGHVIRVSATRGASAAAPQSSGRLRISFDCSASARLRVSRISLLESMVVEAMLAKVAESAKK